MEQGKKETNGWKERLEIALANSDFIKITFKYPGYEKVTFRRGKVTKVFDNSFNFDDVETGIDTYSYDYIILVEKKEGPKGEVKHENHL